MSSSSHFFTNHIVTIYKLHYRHYSRNNKQLSCLPELNNFILIFLIHCIVRSLCLVAELLGISLVIGHEEVVEDGAAFGLLEI